ncbi:hypothetical protein PC9H_003508 [Pleurotus ostreatus]|uniref:Sec39 domain-containing protein n=2 Tax=Pleurotus TaxID=5320 RepID=A0A8H6ZYH2_PLEOS|nr:uncharacterized protein PC9H_003508 [Pleurotus ostreatus]KAF7436675.1 hypothetical protein PC9H_003508 [Pleurotus ostreatus]KAG9222673.1 hypothetical protein CCMSSC00406_0004587 [Pleurotus cornucopiae]
MPASQNPYTRWTNIPDAELTADDVEQVLKPLTDDVWVVAACFDRLVDDVPLQRELLDLGLQRSEGALGRSREAALFNSQPSTAEDTLPVSSADALAAHFRGVPADARLCWMRSVLLDRLDRLNTYEEILKTAPLGGRDASEEADDWEDDPWADEGGSSAAGQPSASATPQFPISPSEFLSDDLWQSAISLTTLQWLEASRTLLQRHSAKLWKYRFSILHCIPAHLHPTEYRDWLPEIDPTTDGERLPVENNWRACQDWSESPEAQLALTECPHVSFPELSFSQDGDHEPHTHPEPLSSDELSSWYKRRVDHIISSTGMIDVALAIVQHGASRGVPALDELGEELSLLSRLVYDAPQNAQSDDDWTLARWRTMDSSTVIRSYLKNSTPESIAEDISRLVLPYLFVIEARAERAGNPDPSLPTRILYDYILSAPLSLVASIFEASKPTLPVSQRLIRNDEDVARLALACLYGCGSLDEWPTMSRIFECMPAWDIAQDEDNDGDTADTTIALLSAFVTPTTSRAQCTPADLLVFFKPLPIASLSRALDILDIHLESGEILSRWSVPAPLRWFLQSHNDASQQRAWATRMARRAGGTSDKLDTLDDWEWLLEDMLKLTNEGESGLRGSFGLLPRNEVIGIFLGGLLSSGKLDIAQSLLKVLRTKLSLESQTIEDICLTCSREFYDNASSGNYKFGDMKLAYDCLDLPPPSPRIIQEKEFIEATSRLASFNITSRPGIPISPIEIRLTKDRLSLVAQVLSSNADAYKHTEVILELVRKLGFRDDTVAEVRTLAMLADSALQGEDFTRAYDANKRMIDIVHNFIESAPLGKEDVQVKQALEVCWVACYQLGRQPEFDDVEKKLSLLGYALELCPRDKLHDILISWRRLETEDIEARQERLEMRRNDPTTVSAKRKPAATVSSYPAASLRARLQHFHMPTPPLLSTPDAAALATRTFRSVAANFPFSVGSRGRSQASHLDDAASSRSGSRRPEGDDVSAQASRVLSKGIGWLIGDE